MSRPYVPQPRRPIGPDQLDYLTSRELKSLVDGHSQLWETAAQSRHSYGLATFHQEIVAAAFEVLERRGGVELSDDERADFEAIRRRVDRE